MPRHGVMLGRGVDPVLSQAIRKMPVHVRQAEFGVSAAAWALPRPVIKFKGNA